MGSHQSQMSRQVIFLLTELNPTQKMLKPSFQLSQLEVSDAVNMKMFKPLLIRGKWKVGFLALRNIEPGEKLC